MRRDDPGPPVVSAAQPVREPERAWYARGPGIDLRILSLLVIPIAAAILTAAEFQQFATDSEEAARVADRAARERMLTMRMAWAAERVGRGEDSARRELAADRVEFVHVLGELGAIQPQAEQHSGAALVGLRLAIEQVVHAYVQLRPAFDRMLAPETTRAAQLAALEDIRRATPLQLRDVEGILSGLATVESEHRQVELERLALLVGVQTSCVLIIVLWFAFRVRRARRREAELRPFAQIARHTSSGLAIADADRRVLWTNEACKLLTMVEPAELCGKTLDDWFASALVPAGLPDKAVFTRGFRCEVELSRPTGPPAWVDLEVVPARDQDGRIEQYVVTLQDITARVETMNALHESDARFRSALDAMQEGLVVQHADGTIEICNPAAERILGMSSDQLCGRTSLDPRWRSVHEDGSPFPGDAHPAMVSLRSGKEQRGVIMGLQKAAGEMTWISIDTGLIHRPGEAKPYKVVCTFADITARREADQSLRKFTRAVEQSPAAVVITDSDARIEFVNNAFERISGYTAAEVLGRDPRMLASGETPRSLYETMWAALRKGEEWRGELKNRRKDGRLFLADQSIFPLRGDDGGITHFVALTEDVTEVRQREADLTSAREAAVDAARAKTEFVQNISHELRTPMNGILGMSELLLLSPLSTAQRNDVLTLRQSAEQLLGIISQLFDFARPGSGDEPIQQLPFLLRPCLHEVSDKLTIEAANHGLAWSMEIAPDVPDALVGDAGGMRQVLFHLLSNAIKFTEKGEVRLTVGSTPGPDGSARLQFRVRDTGIGIAAERLASIFEAFRQADGSRTRRFGGIGLGLTLASRLVKLLSGTLSVKSEVGKGSTFECELPFALAAKGATRGTHADALEGAPILVLDGGEAPRTGILALLERWGANVCIVRGPEAAIAAARHAAEQDHPFAFLLIDQRAGGFDAFEAAEKLTASPGLPPVLALLATRQEGDAARCERAGVIGFLAEPDSEQDLHELLLRAGSHTGPNVLTVAELRAKRRERRLLLVEDNPVNRKVALRLLEHSGFQVSLAVNGREAVDSVAETRFDLVLMDIQMPEMDGLEATRRIREGEAGTKRHLPIIALTAHTMSADLESARAAGMDDLVAKPIRPAVLLDAIRRQCADPDAPEREPVVMAPRLEEVLEWDEAIERMDGAEDVLLELLALFVSDSPNMLKRLDDACQSDDLQALERAAHGLKGASATISGRVVAALASRVEQLARASHRADALVAASDLRHEMCRLVAALTVLAREGRKAA